ncbi:MAG: hypothetical protein AB1394_00545 [Bacteroidota bacterium]
MADSTLRIVSKTDKLLQEIKGISGESMLVVISKALENYKQLQFWNEAKETYLKLKNDKRAW